MRSEQQMFDLILNTAKQDDRIRGVILNGSRANPNAPKDIFQDYDIVYLVMETASFLSDSHWIDRFGEPLIFQFPDQLDANLHKPVHFDSEYGYLMQFSDGTRIDLHICTLPKVLQNLKEDPLSIILLDKDQCLPEIPVPSDQIYHVKPPLKAEFDCCCSDFYWVLLYVAKGLWRQEVLYALDCMDTYVRPRLLQMLTWAAGIRTNYSVSVGKSGKYLKQYLPAQWWEDYLQTYCDAKTQSIWAALFMICDLFLRAALFVAKECDFVFDQDQAQKSVAFAKHICTLPQDAKQIL